MRYNTTRTTVVAIQVQTNRSRYTPGKVDLTRKDKTMVIIPIYRVKSNSKSLRKKRPKKSNTASWKTRETTQTLKDLTLKTKNSSEGL
jgi:hypothetical protein